MHEVISSPIMNRKGDSDSSVAYPTKAHPQETWVILVPDAILSSMVSDTFHWSHAIWSSTVTDMF
jgi:hypothetical protein